jgi:hypothetical protein
MDLKLTVIVPRDLHSRAATLSKALAGTAIGVVVDRRQGERRRARQEIDVERRKADRRATPRIVAYAYSCPVVAVGVPSGAGALPTSRASALNSGVALGGVQTLA